MHSLNIFLFSLLLFPVSAIAQECVRGEPEPILDANAIENYQWLGEGNGSFEKGDLADGTSFVLVHEGCAHFSLTWTYSIEGPKDADQASILRKGASLLRRTPSLDPWAHVLERIVQKLYEVAEEGAYQLGDPIAIEAGYTYLYVQATQKEAGFQDISITYDIAL